MKRSTDRILATHTGSLPRPASVVDLLLAEETDRGAHAAEFDAADMFDIGNKETLENARRLFRG